MPMAILLTPAAFQCKVNSVSFMQKTIEMNEYNAYAVVIFRVKASCFTSVDGITLVIDLIGQSSRNVIGRRSVKP